MKKLMLYGDSNTYGYDPRGYLGMRYPEECIWTTMVKKRLEGQFDVIEEGMNGRVLPDISREESFLSSLFSVLGGGDVLLMMLGTNDILLTDHPNADAAIGKMEQFIKYFQEIKPKTELIVVGPPPIATGVIEFDIYYDESARMNKGFEKLCERYGIKFFDAASWNIKLSADGVHFSEEGHRRFAECFLENM